MHVTRISVTVMIDSGHMNVQVSRVSKLVHFEFIVQITLIGSQVHDSNLFGFAQIGKQIEIVVTQNRPFCHEHFVFCKVPRCKETHSFFSGWLDL